MHDQCAHPFELPFSHILQKWGSGPLHSCGVSQPDCARAGEKIKAIDKIKKQVVFNFTFIAVVSFPRYEKGKLS